MIDVIEVYETKVRSLLTIQEQQAFERALRAPLRRAIYLQANGKIHWYCLAPKGFRGKTWGVSDTMAEAVARVDRIYPIERAAQ